MIRGKILIAAVVGFVTMLVSSHVFAQVDVIEKRQKLMKSNSADAKAINNAAKEKDYATIETKAKEIVDNAGQIVELFPKGSTKGKTKATAAIWEKPDEFAKNAKNLGKAASDLAAAAKAKNDAEITIKVKALGDVCGSCHDAFRAQKYSE